MATAKEEAPPQGRAVEVEEERAEKQLDSDAVSEMCRQHCGGVPASYGADERKPTAACTTATEFDDGSGDAGKCGDMNQQAEHYKCADKLG